VSPLADKSTTCYARMVLRRRRRRRCDVVLRLTVQLARCSEFFSLFLDEDLLTGRSDVAEPYNNLSLPKQSPFKVQTVELWGFMAPDRVELILQKDEAEGQRRSALDSKENTFVLDLLGRHFSDGER
jgi:hypothetical protein